LKRGSTLRIIDSKENCDRTLIENAPKIVESLCNESKRRFDVVLNTLVKLNVPFSVDDCLVRGLDYYSHTIFEMTEDHYQSVGRETVIAGGKYDDLFRMISPDSRSVPAFGYNLFKKV
jgi:histidyl-tRNA synthetase